MAIFFNNFMDYDQVNQQIHVHFLLLQDETGQYAKSESLEILLTIYVFPRGNKNCTNFFSFGIWLEGFGSTHCSQILKRNIFRIEIKSVRICPNRNQIGQDMSEQKSNRLGCSSTRRHAVGLTNCICKLLNLCNLSNQSAIAAIRLQSQQSDCNPSALQLDYTD